MKKRNMKKVSKELDLSLGIKGLKISFFILLFFVICLLINLLFMGLTLLQIIFITLRVPTQNDYPILFAGFILFIVIPFVLGIKLKK